ncbi:pyridoxamine 5'-phosphate oxidase [Jannaschia sp. EhC01]|nr:pyridoxamine 5'-phosphate oxidase [Jannaschia sp. EhC01]
MPLGMKLNATLRAFIARQQMFFVATAAPLGRVNMSPKGADSLRVLSDTHVQWLNLSGSGNETAGHLLQSDRMTLMFCAFEGDALILRLYGTATTLHPRDAGWAEAAARFPKMAGTRQIFDMQIQSVNMSCGSGVPFMDYKSDRSAVEMIPYFEDLGPEGTEAFWRRKNTETIDGQPTALFED